MKAVAATVLRYDVSANGVLELVLNRPTKLNAMQPVFFEELDTLVTRAIEDDSVRVILLHGGESKGFSAGLDLSSVGSVLPSGADPTETTAEKSAKVCLFRPLRANLIAFFFLSVFAVVARVAKTISESEQLPQASDRCRARRLHRRRRGSHQCLRRAAGFSGRLFFNPRSEG